MRKLRNKFKAKEKVKTPEEVPSRNKQPAQ